MMSNNKSILSQAKTLSTLTKSQIEIWLTLQNIYTHCKTDHLLGDDGSISPSNQYLSSIHNSSPETVSRAIHTLKELNFIKVEYKDSRYGRERRIWINEN